MPIRIFPCRMGLVSVFAAETPIVRRRTAQTRRTPGQQAAPERLTAPVERWKLCCGGGPAQARAPSGKGGSHWKGWRQWQRRGAQPLGPHPAEARAPLEKVEGTGRSGASENLRSPGSRWAHQLASSRSARQAWQGAQRALRDGGPHSGTGGGTEGPGPLVHLPPPGELRWLRKGPRVRPGASSWLGAEREVLLHGSREAGPPRVIECGCVQHRRPHTLVPEVRPTLPKE